MGVVPVNPYGDLAGVENAGGSPKFASNIQCLAVGSLPMTRSISSAEGERVASQFVQCGCLMDECQRGWGSDPFSSQLQTTGTKSGWVSA